MSVSHWLAAHSGFRDRPLVAYGFAVLMVFLALCVRWIVGDYLQDVFFITIFPAVVIATVAGGFGPGLAATILGGFSAWYFLIPPYHSFALRGVSDGVALGTFFAVASVLSWLTDSMMRANALNLQLARQKEALILEIEHRLRNQLQFISSMLRVEERAVKDPDAAAALNRAAQRIRTIVEVQNRLFRPDGDSQSLGSYLEMLCRDLVRSSGLTNVIATVEVDGVSLSNERVLPVSLVVTELVSNSLKHGLSQVEAGRIDVKMACTDGTIELVVSDNGRGVVPQRTPERGGLGLRLVELFAGQLDGRLETVPGQGARFRLTFPA